MKRAGANIYEVAELAGVSLATVSRVINPGAKVSDKTRQKVLAAMEKLGFRPNSIAQSLATRSSNSVGVIVSELHGPFFGSMLSVIEDTLRAAGKFVLVAASHSKEDQEREAHSLSRQPQLRRADRAHGAAAGQIPRGAQRASPHHSWS